MYKTLLVGPDLETGGRMLKALDDAGVKIHVAFWAFLSRYEDWRLVLSSRQLDEAGVRGGYALVFKTLKKAGFTVEDTEPIMIESMKDKFIRELRRAYGKDKRTAGRRLSQQSIGDRFIEDGYVYRIT